ncbi:CHASE2 domain-containing protein [Variovorax sp. PAMC28562]|uniref:sensor histidine kinase n=1 Tax=Variovorax sp. PAMC28562 TaxID=2762323 RepID=UPI00164E443A|nr:CHASE2 domain-containing protein [Variovorax sp. PAMC28562]QNK72917.1 CHASE2 domain-containing protein [Variovorax sp. PAMC28562]
MAGVIGSFTEELIRGKFAMQMFRQFASMLRKLKTRVALRVLLAVLLPLAIVWKVDHTTPTVADGRLYDRVMASVAAPVNSEVEIISIDAQSIQEIGPWPWPAAIHTEFLRQLSLQAPHAVVLNFRLGFPKLEGDDDAALAAALRNLPVYLTIPSYLSGAVVNQSEALRSRTRHFSAVVQGIGHSSLSADDSSKRLRFVSLFAPAPDDALPYVGAMVAPAPPLHRAIANGTHLQFGIPFNGEAAHPSISYSEVLAGKLSADRLKGRIVVVGPTNGVPLGRQWYVSGSSGATLVTSTEVHASAIDALQQGTYVSVAPPVVLGLAMALSILAVLFAFDKLPKAAPLVGLAFIASGVAVSALMLRLLHIWLPSSFFVFGIFAAYLLWTWQHLYQVLGFLKEHIVALSQVPSVKSDRVGPVRVGANDPVERYIGALDHAILRLMRLEAYMRFSLLKLPIAVVLCRTDGGIDVLNAAAAALLPELSPTTRSTAKESFPAIIAQLESKSSIRRPELNEHWSQALDGEYKTPLGKIFSIEATCIDDVPAPAPATWIVVLRELTQQRQAESERAKWLNFLWHDLRSPQINLLSLVELYEMKSSRLGVAELMTGVRREAERTIALAQSFISVATSEARDYEFAVVSLSSLLAKSVEELAAYALARHVQLPSRSMQIHHDLVRADGGMLLRVFGNLLENAIRHSAPGDIIWANCHVEKGLEAVVTIRDEGTGMAPVVLDALLDRGAQGLTEAAKLSASQQDIEAAHNIAPRDARTHGFGFAMVRQVVAAHGGWISGQSTVGEGTTFAIGFPLVHAEKQFQ